MSVDLHSAVDSPALFKALAEPIRWQIVQRLAEEELCVCHLVEDLGVAQPLLSHHLKVLRSAGLVEAERYKQWTYNRLRPDVMSALAEHIGLLAQDSPRADRRPCC